MTDERAQDTDRRQPIRKGKGVWKGLLWHARRKPLGAVAAFILLVLVVTAICTPLLAPHDPYKQSFRAWLQPPSQQYLLGTDTIGRDLLSRIIYGARISLGIGLVATCIGTLCGTFIGLVSGFWGGKLDLLLQRLIDCLLSFPTLILALAIVAVLGSSITNVVLAIAIVQTPRVSRIVRGNALIVKEEAYIEAARAIGCRSWRILMRYLLPNVMAPIVVVASINLGNAIVIEAALGFLGLGTPPPIPSWGEMLSGAGKQYMVYAPWLAIFPGVAISLAVLGFNLLGDALRDILDPRLRGT
ncbi:MAG: ABC transporter permease [Candidatus Entotheonellia bacterium]